MSVTETSQVTVDREAIIDALAHFEAAQLIFFELEGNVSPTELSEPFGVAMSDLWIAALGEPPEDDAEYETDPVRVEVEARGAEIAAAALKASIAELEEAVIGNLGIGRGLPDRVRHLVERAAATREQGTIAPKLPEGADA